MENKATLQDQNTKSTDSNLPIQPNTMPGKPKVNWWMISTFILSVFLVIDVLFQLTGKQSAVSKIIPTTSTPTTVPSVQLQNTTLQANNVGLDSELVFSEGNNVYTVKNDGVVKKIVTIAENINYLKTLPNNQGFFVESNVTDQNNSLTSKQYLMNLDGKITATDIKPCDNQYCLQTYDVNYLTKYELGITRELENGQADILLESFDGSQPVKIGHLNNKPIERQTCEIGDNCTAKFYPASWVTSFDGSYLLNLPPHGGGLGEPGLVISRDGNKVYKIDFYWYVSSVAWISNNRLLTQDQSGAKIFTFNADGTFQTQKLESSIGEQFSQKWLSPDRKKLAVMNYNPSFQISIFDVANLSKKMIVSLPTGSDPTSAIVIGWNDKSNELLYTLGNEVKIYNTERNTDKTVATFNPPAWVVTNSREFARNIFDIR